MSAGRTRLRPRTGPELTVDGRPPGAEGDASSTGRKAGAAEQRMRRRLRRRRLRRWVVVAVPVLVLALLATAGWVLLASPMFAVTTVQVDGTHRLTPDQVRQAADVPIGRAMLRLDLGSVQQRVAALRVVRSATVTERWPHTVVVTVVERTPIATAQTAAGSWWLLDADGVAVTQASSRPTGLVLVALDPLTATPDTLAAASSVAGSLPSSVRRLVRDVTAQTPDSVQLDLVGGAVVRWGNDQDNATKAQVLAALLPHHAHVYDVTAPGFATTS